MYIKEKTKHCPDCDILIADTSERCRKCALLHKKAINAAIKNVEEKIPGYNKYKPAEYIEIKQLNDRYIEIIAHQQNNIKKMKHYNYIINKALERLKECHVYIINAGTAPYKMNNSETGMIQITKETKMKWV